MSGTASNAALWQNADVYIAATGTAGPTDVATAWGAGWTPVGLLDGEKGFAEGRAENSSDFYAWGGALVRRTKSQHKRTIKFTCLEDNLTVFGLVNPGSTRTTAAGVTTSTVKVPSQQDVAIGFETRDGLKVKRRSVLRAQVDAVADVVDAENGVTMYEVTVILFPDSSGVLYTEVAGTLAS